VNSGNDMTQANHSAANMKMDAGVGEARPKKPYCAPQMFEHGSVEKITGLDEAVGHSGLTASNAGPAFIATSKS